MIDEQSIKNIEEMEQMSGQPSGIGKIHRRECPTGGQSPMACMFCSFGHMTHCHWPQTCSEAECSHYFQSLDDESSGFDEEVF